MSPIEGVLIIFYCEFNSLIKIVKAKEKKSQWGSTGVYNTAREEN